MSRTFLTFGDIAGKAPHRMHAMRVQGQLQRRQAPRSTRPSGQYEQVGVRSLRRLPETERRSAARALRPDLPRSSEGDLSCSRCSIAASDPANAPIVPLDGDGPAPTEPSTRVGVTAISVAIVPVTMPRSPDVNSNAGSLNVHTLSQSRRWGYNDHRAHARPAAGKPRV
jgi:hypothetical protein